MIQQLISIVFLLVLMENSKNTIVNSLNANSINKRTDYSQLSGQSTRQCECWKWPDCISNCTVNPILKKLLASEHRKIDKIPTPFIVIFPYQVRKQNHKKIDTSTLNKQGNYRLETNFWVHLLNGEDLQLQLRKSSIFGDESKRPRNFYLKYYQKSQEVISNNLQKCFYTGTVMTEHSNNNVVFHSYVAADTCDGLRGIILYKGTIYGIKPLKHPQANPNEPVAHFIYPETTVGIEKKAANLQTFWHMLNVIPRSQPNSNEPQSLIVPLSIFVDHTLLSSFEGSGSNQIQSATYFALSVINYVTKAFISIKQIKIELASIEMWNLKDKMLISPSIKTSLSNFLKYRLKESSKPANMDQRRGEISILLSGVRFVEDVEYFSVPGTVCTKRSVSVIQVTSVKEVYHVSRLLGLAIAEIFGINSFPCPQIYECSTRTVLSKGDESKLKLAILSQHANCLQADSKIAVLDTCGNGQLDRGEECDYDAANLDKRKLCCDSKSCMVANYAQCTFGGCCSNNCTYLTRGRYCRPAADQCDIPEFCSGESGNCPKNIFLENGQPCEKGTALCYQGRCPTRNNQCQRLWGSKSRESNRHCYSSYNLKHDDGCGNRGKCDKENYMCGILHCAGGADRLVDNAAINTNSDDQGPVFLDTYIRFEKDKLQCKFLNDPLHRYVEDGSQCGDNQYCFGKVCMSIGSSNIPSKCAKDITINYTRDSVCFSKGICTNLGICLCHPGWTGENCTISLNDTKLEPGVWNKKKDGLHYSEQVKHFIWAYFKEIGLYNGPLFMKVNNLSKSNETGIWSKVSKFQLIIILSVTIGLIFVAFVIFMVCYRRRFVYKSKKAKNIHGSCNNGGGKWGRKNHHSELSSRKEADLRLDAGIIGTKRNRGGNGRRNRRRSSNGGSNRRLCRDMGDGNESTGAASDGGMNHHHNNHHHHSHHESIRVGSAQSDTDVAKASGTNSRCQEESQTSNGPNNGSVDRMIKFGCMPSYKENKLTPIHQPVQNNTVQDIDSLILFTRSSDPLISNVSSPCHSDQQASSLLRNNPHISTDHPTNPTDTFQHPQYPHSQPSTSIHSSLSPTHQHHLILTSPCKKELFHAPIGLPAPALFPSVPYPNSTQSNVILTPQINPTIDKVTTDLVMKQPEKGILKNKGDNNNNIILDKSLKTKHSTESKKRHKHHHKHTTQGDSTTSPSSTSASQSDSDENSASTSSSTSSSSSSTSANSNSNRSESSNSSSNSSALSASLITHPSTTSNNKSKNSKSHKHNKSGNGSSSNNNNDTSTSTTTNGSGNKKKKSHSNSCHSNHHHNHHHHQQAPTILCNAANQTDDDIINMTISPTPAIVATNQNTDNISEYLEEECDEQDCEECIRLRQQELDTNHANNTTQTPTLNSVMTAGSINAGILQHPQQQQQQLQRSNRNKSPPETLITSNSSAYDIVGSTTDDGGYHQYNNSNNLHCFSTDSSGSTSYHNQMHPVTALLTVSNEEGSSQNSETEVDSHLQMLMHTNQPHLHQPPHYVGPPLGYPQPIMIPENMQSPNRSIMLMPQGSSSIVSNPMLHQNVNTANYQPHYPYSLSSSSYYYPPITNHGTDLSHLHGNPHRNRRQDDDDEDLVSEVSISAYCRVPTTLSQSSSTSSNQHGSYGDSHNSNSAGGGLGYVGSGLSPHMEAGSNDGTIDEGSDTSSLPDANCDLFHHISSTGAPSMGPARPNPMLGQVLRAQNQRESAQKNNQDVGWLQNTRNEHNKSPNQLPNPDSIQTGVDFLA